MSSNSLSINQRLSKAKSIDTKKEILRDWLANLDADLTDVIRETSGAGFAGRSDDVVTGCIKLHRIREKHIKAMTGIIERIEVMR